ncbi:MAG TPA: DUF2442 domain-containing protein [Chthoniobacterales bacterium]|nr:DUF2442 domain-containing protein [Chthoniobacterales bacterium]
MRHPIYRVTSFEQTGPYALRIQFDDGSSQTIDLEPVLAGELYGPLRNPAEFARVKIDPEVNTLVWPSGADFDPATLHDWPTHEAAFRAAAQRWSASNDLTRFRA